MGTINRAATVTIANGQTVSNGINLNEQQVVGLVTPAALTGVAITFQASHDGVTYSAVTKEDGTAYSITVAPSKYVMIPRDALGGDRNGWHCNDSRRSGDSFGNRRGQF